MKAFKKIKYNNEEEWLSIRRVGIGGSDISAIMGYNKYKSALDVYNEKINGLIAKETEAMYWGRILEPIIAEEFAKIYQLKIQKPKYIMQSIKYPFLIASVDYFVKENGETGILEIKTTNEYVYKTWSYGLPISYYLQLQHYLAVTNYNFGYIAILINGQRLERLRFERDDETIEQIIKSAKEFYEKHLIPQIPPQINPNYDEIIPEGELEANNEILSIYNRIMELEIEYEKLGKELEMEKEKLKELIKDKEVVTLDGTPIITYKAIIRNTFDAKKFQEENPILYQQYVKQTNYRQLKIIK